MNEITLLTVNQFCEKHPAFTKGGVRALLFNAEPRHTSKGLIEGNGLKHAILRIGAKILIDEAAFFAWVRAQNGGAK